MSDSVFVARGAAGKGWGGGEDVAWVESGGRVGWGGRRQASKIPF